MIVCFNCDTETKNKMDIMLQKDQYNGYSELLAVAVSNLWLLDQEVTRNGSLVIGESSLLTTFAAPRRMREKSKPLARGPVDLSQANSEFSKQPFIPDIFLIGKMDTISIDTLEAQIDILSIGKTFTLDRWIFGQYNKLLPAKANCRALARLTLRHEKGIPLTVAAPEIARAASTMSEWLIKYDRENNIGRDDALSTAFPHNGPDTEKSQVRYLNHFLGSVNMHGQLSGLLWDYRLAALSKTDPPEILLTAPGLAFAKLKNPILDGRQDQTPRKLSMEESSFLMDHIQHFVPVEDFAFKTLLKSVHEGANTPEKLGEALRPFVPSDSARPLSNSFLASQRSGALSRMSDMGLIVRIRQGVRVTYAITDFGRNYIESR